VPGSNVEADVVSADDGVKVSVDVGSDISCQNDVTVTSESAVGRPAPSDVELSSAKLADQSSVGAARTSDTGELAASELSSQESSVTRTRSRGCMDFEHLRKKLVELTGTNKEAAAGHGATTGKIKSEVEEVKDTSVDAVGAVPSPALNATPNSASQVSVGRAVTSGQQLLAVNLAVDSHHGPCMTPEPSGQLTAPVQAASQQTSLPELPVTAAVPRDSSVPPGAVAVGQVKLVPSDDEHAAAPVQPVKPVPVYPVTLSQPLTQQKLMSGPVTGQVNGSTVIPHGMLAPDMQAAMLHQQQQQQMASAVDSAAGFVPVLATGVGDVSCPSSPDSVSQVTAQPQPTAVDYSQASLLALYNQMMMPLPLMAPAWPALSLNPFLVAANPLLAAQMMYGAPLMRPASELLGQMPASDAQLGMQGYAVAGQQPAMPGLGCAPAERSVRATGGLMPSTSTALPSSLAPVGAAARHVAPRLPGHEHLAAMQATGVQRKRPDRPPYLASLEQALIEKLHGPRKPVAATIPGRAVHSPAVQSFPGTMSWFPVPPSAHSIHTPTAVQSPVISLLFNTDLQPPTSVCGLTADMTASVNAYATLPGTSLTGTFTHSGRTTPSVVTAADCVTGKSVAAAVLPSAHKLTSESHEASAPLDVDSTLSTGQTPPKHKTVSAVKDDPVSHLQESTAACEASSQSSQNPQDITVSTQTCAPVTSASKAPVKKGRFRISDVKEGVDVAVSNSQLESSSQSQEAAVMSGARTDPSGNCDMAAAVMAPELVVQQVRDRMLSALALSILVFMLALIFTGRIACRHPAVFTLCL